jgi:sec-independent protein translocase protein TatC
MGDENDLPLEEEDGGGEVKSFLEHLEDLRWTLIKSLTGLMLAMIVCLVAGDKVFWILERPLTLANAKLPLESRIKLTFLNPAAPFLASLHLAFFGGILLASPFIFYFVVQFVLPALKVKEKKYFFRACAIGSGLFFSGVAVCYFLIMPVALRAAVVYSHWLLGKKVVIESMWMAEAYCSFTTKFMIGMGLGFELPVVLLTMVKLGVLDYRKLASMRRYMIVICLVMGALLTTPEVLTQVLMAVPLYMLYEASVWIAWYWERQEKKKQETEAGLATNAKSSG